MNSRLQALLSQLRLEQKTKNSSILLPKQAKYEKKSPEKRNPSQSETYWRANLYRNFLKIWWWNAVCFMVAAYFLGENPIKSLNQAIDGAMERLGRSYKSSASMAELRRYVRNYLEIKIICIQSCVWPKKLSL